MQADDLYQDLMAENDRLRARIQDLEEALFAGVDIPVEWPLTPNECRIMGCLLSRPLMTKDAAMAALYRNAGRDEADPKIVDVHICHMRRKLKPFGIEIETVWGQGYRLDEAVRRDVRARMAGSVTS